MYEYVRISQLKRRPSLGKKKEQSKEDQLSQNLPSLYPVL
jgi:hypothetical protein